VPVHSSTLGDYSLLICAQSRRGPDEVVLVYTSPRQMCALAIGIGKGLAKHFKETITVDQTMCMLKGAPKCEMVLRKIRQGAVSFNMTMLFGNPGALHCRNLFFRHGAAVPGLRCRSFAICCRVKTHAEGIR